MSRRQLQDLRAIVTGASSGIGRALALEFARRGTHVLVTARRSDRLRQLADEMARIGPEPLVVAGDVTLADVRSAILAEAEAHWGRIDLLVNNAGVSAQGRFADAREDQLRRILEVNFIAAAELTRASLPLLRRGVCPMIVNVSSILGRRAIPFHSEYCASKFALTGWSEALRAELSGEGIDLLVLAPGTTDTEFTENLLQRTVELPWHQGAGDSAAVVARATVRAIERGRHEVIPSRSGWWLVLGARLFPRLIDRIMARYGKQNQTRTQGGGS